MGTSSSDPGILSRRATWLRHATATDILRDVLEVFEAADVEALPVKGIVTAHALYGDVADRPMGDIDLRLRRRDFHHALAAAHKAGWETFEEAPRLWDGGIRMKGWEVEIECTVGPPGLSSMAVDELLERASRTDAGLGFPHLEPGLHDHALVLCANAFKDLRRPTPWALEDLLRIASARGFDPSVLTARAHAGRMATAVWIVAAWMADRHGSTAWQEVRDRIGRAPPRALFAAAFARFAARDAPSPHLAVLVCASAGDGLAHAARGLGLGAYGSLRSTIRRRVR
jgi:hypothetical protein